MKKQHTKTSCIPAGLPEAIVVFAICIAVFLVILIIRLSALDSAPPEALTETVSVDVQQDILAQDITLPLVLGEGITLTGLHAADALFPEDGSNAPSENLLCAVVHNDTQQTLEYMTFTLQNGDETYDFSVSTLPPGKDVYVFEKNAAQVPEKITELQTECQVLLFFTEEPDLMEDTLEITVQDGSIAVKNITDVPIGHEIQVYYKNTENLAYYGGITYFMRVPAGLAAGETYSGYASNASTARTEVMFVKYGN